MDSHSSLVPTDPALIALMHGAFGKDGTLLPFAREIMLMVFEESGRRQLGYVPRVKNEVLARLMDAGKLLFGRMESKEWHGDWLKIEARIYMRDL